jgi:hypothetical protein
VVVGTALVLAPSPAAVPPTRPARSAVPARKVGMKRVPRKTLKPVVSSRNSGRGKKA